MRLQGLKFAKLEQKWSILLSASSRKGLRRAQGECSFPGFVAVFTGPVYEVVKNVTEPTG